MMRLAAGAFAVALFWAPLRAAPIRPVVIVDMVGLLLAAVGLATLRRGLVTAGACVFLADYAAALWIAGGPVGIAGAVAFGLSLLFLLETLEMGRRARHATVGGTVTRVLVARGMGIGVATLAASTLAMPLARATAASIPFAAAPFAAVTGALGVVLALAAAVTGAARAAPGQRPGPPPT